MSNGKTGFFLRFLCSAYRRRESEKREENLGGRTGQRREREERGMVVVDETSIQ